MSVDKNINENVKKSLKHDTEDYREYLIDEGVKRAGQIELHRHASDEKEKMFNMLLKMVLPWQREVAQELIDDIKSYENERSSIEMDCILDLIYEEKNF